MPFPNRAGGPRKRDYQEIVDYWVLAKKNNPHFTKAACARVFRISTRTVTRILQKYGLHGKSDE